jgi:hypothetical protein
MGCKGVDYNELTHNRVHWQAFVNIAVNFQFYKSTEFLDQLSSHQFFCGDFAMNVVNLSLLY